MTSGPALFARFAYPPNERELCGPPDSAALLEASTDPVGVTELRHLAAGFHGAWPYLQLIAAGLGLKDPLAEEVVSAYWLGGPGLHRVPAALLMRSMADRFSLGAQPLLADGLAHHNFHVFCVYPFAGLLRGDQTGEPLRVLDQCRIRTGEVRAVVGDRALVASTSLTFDGTQLGVRDAEQTVRWSRRGYSLARPPRVGEQVALHWDWLCSPVSPEQRIWVGGMTERHLRIANRALTAADRIHQAGG